MCIGLIDVDGHNFPNIPLMKLSAWHKADPRLDTSHPLTYDEMREMPGQPVWHSNTDQWAIIADEPMYADRITVRHSDGTFTNVSREDSIAKPWYRMKQGEQ